MKFNKITGVCFCLWIISFVSGISLKACDNEEDYKNETEKKIFQPKTLIIPSEIIGAIADYSDFEPQIDSNIPYLKEKYGHLYQFRLINSSFRQGIDQYLIDHLSIADELNMLVVEINVDVE